MNNNFSQCISSLCEIENIRKNKVLLIGAPHLDLEILPTLFDTLNTLGVIEHLDVILFGRGGETIAARAVGKLLRKYCQSLTVIVPYQCQSSYTALALCADEIIAGDLAIFSPIDPAIDCAPHGSLSSEDIRVFPEMSEQWFAISDEQTKAELLSAIASSVFPTNLSGLFRASKEMFEISLELIDLSRSSIDKDKQTNIIHRLTHNYHSHGFPITNDDLAQMGLPIVRHAKTEAMAWSLSKNLRLFLGGEGRRSIDDVKTDAVIGTASELFIRQLNPAEITPRWLNIKD